MASTSIELINKGNLKHITAFLETMQSRDFIDRILSNYAEEGVRALAEATPKDTGETANSWDYEIVREPGFVSIYFTNSHKEWNGPPIALLIQYGHGTGTGGYVQGRDYINPAIRGTFDKMAEAIWKEVQNA